MDFLYFLVRAVQLQASNHINECEVDISTFHPRTLERALTLFAGKGFILTAGILDTTIHIEWNMRIEPDEKKFIKWLISGKSTLDTIIPEKVNPRTGLAF